MYVDAVLRLNDSIAVCGWRLRPEMSCETVVESWCCGSAYINKGPGRYRCRGRARFKLPHVPTLSSCTPSISSLFDIVSLLQSAALIN